MKPTCPSMKLSVIAAPAATTIVKAALFAGILMTVAPTVVLGQSTEKKGTTPYVTHFVFRPLTSIDIAELGKATTLEAAAIKILAERKIGAVMVMSNGRIEGILSERDIVRVLGERGARVLDEPVSAVMTREVVSCRQTDTVAAIMEIMTLGKFRHLPVVEEGMVVGLISIGDIVKWRVREYEIEQEALRDYIKTA